MMTTLVGTMMITLVDVVVVIKVTHLLQGTDQEVEKRNMDPPQIQNPVNRVGLEQRLPMNNWFPLKTSSKLLVTCRFASA